MGAVVNETQDESDIKELRTLSELMPAYKRYFSHHTRNSISAIMLSIDMAIEKLDDPFSKEEIRNHLHRIKLATDHLMSDLRKVGI